MTDLDRDIAALEATLRHLKKLRKSERMQGRRHSDVTKAKMSAARKAAWAEKYEADLAPKQRRESRKGLPPVPRDPFEALLFGGGAR